MTKRTTSIQINGRRYDALSGAPLDFELTSPEPTHHKQPVSKSIDGFISNGKPQAAKVAPVKSVSAKPSTVKTTTSVKTTTHKPKTTHRAPAKHAVVKKGKPSSTLMRSAVTKPSASLKRSAKVQTATHHSIKKSSAVVIPKTSIHGVNHLRASRAAQHRKSDHVSHFKRDLSLAAKTIVQDAKEVAATIDNAIVIPQTYAPSTSYQPDIRRVRIVTKDQKTSDIFEQALLRATSHEQPEVEPVKERGRLRALRRRMVSFTAGAVAVLALVGAFGFKQQDAIQFRAAASQASFSARMPGYKPVGYSLNDVRTSGDHVYMQYSSADRSYTISERQTVWGNETLIEKLAASQDSATYNMVQTQGRTIYLYGRNQAAWIHNGVLYQVLGNGALGVKDFTQIASSM